MSTCTYVLLTSYQIVKQERFVNSFVFYMYILSVHANFIIYFY